MCALVDLVALSSLVGVFREQELQQGEHVMDVVEMIHGLTALYEKLEEERSVLINIPLCVDMCLNWLLNVYDRWVSWGEMFPGLSIKSACAESCMEYIYGYVYIYIQHIHCFTPYILYIYKRYKSSVLSHPKYDDATYQEPEESLSKSVIR